MINLNIISKIFLDYLNNISLVQYEDKLNQLVKLSIERNKKLWNLEDSARMIELGSEHVSKIKQEIDKNNQIRNDLIREIDIEITKQMSISFSDQKLFYSESPGMIIDRLSILFIKLSAIRDLLLVIKEEIVKKEYKEKEEIIIGQINRIGNFLDTYFIKLTNKEVFFEILQPVKIYNDDRIKKYIKILKN
jgi:hypothetical protein